MSLTSSPAVQLPSADRQSQPWVNGQGMTTPITCGPAAGPEGEPLWWINLARIPGDCDFSELIGIERRFMPLDEVALSLDLDGPRAIAPLEVVEFAGEMAPRCSASGPTRAINLMLRRGRAIGTLDVVVVDGAVEMPVPSGGTLVVIKIDGDPGWPGGSDLLPGDAVRQDAGAGPDHLVVDGHGRVAVISVG